LTGLPAEGFGPQAGEGWGEGEEINLKFLEMILLTFSINDFRSFKK
jgi:hypothetical protein